MVLFGGTFEVVVDEVFLAGGLVDVVGAPVGDDVHGGGWAWCAVALEAARDLLVFLVDEELALRLERSLAPVHDAGTSGLVLMVASAVMFRGGTLCRNLGRRRGCRRFLA